MKTKRFNMRHGIAIAVYFALGAATAQAQSFKIGVPPHYGENYEEETGKLQHKHWISEENFRQEMVRDDGSAPTVVIYRADSAKVFLLNADKKTYIAFSMQQALEGKLAGIESLETAGGGVTRKFVRHEGVDGWDCTLWSVTRKSVTKGGSESSVTVEEWRHEPTKLVIRSTDLSRSYGYTLHRNIVIGPQPESMFVIPRDYTAMNVPMGGMLEMFTGKTETQIRESDAAKQAQSQMEQLKEIGNDASKSNEQKAVDIFKMLEGLKKK